MNKPMRSLCLLGLALLLASGALSVAAAAPAPSDPHKVDARLVTLNNDFAFHLYHSLAAKGDGENIFISPTSIELALAMTRYSPPLELFTVKLFPNVWPPPVGRSAPIAAWTAAVSSFVPFPVAP